MVTPAVTDFGGDGADLLLLHGAGGSRHDWVGVAEHLADRFHVVAADLPGHGDTPCPDRWTIPDALAALEDLGLTAPVVAGMSLGGMIAVHWGARHADCPAVVSFDGHRSPVTALSNYRGLDPTHATALRARLKASFDAMVADAQRDAAMLEQISEAMDADNVIPLLAVTPTPTTMVVATRDLPGAEEFAELLTAFRAGLRQDLEAAARVNPAVRTVFLDTSHAMHMEAPDTMARIIRDASGP